MQCKLSLQPPTLLLKGKLPVPPSCEESWSKFHEYCFFALQVREATSDKSDESWWLTFEGYSTCKCHLTADSVPNLFDYSHDVSGWLTGSLPSIASNHDFLSSSSCACNKMGWFLLQKSNVKKNWKTKPKHSKRKL